jgi:hypothetical protein
VGLNLTHAMLLYKSKGGGGAPQNTSIWDCICSHTHLSSSVVHQHHCQQWTGKNMKEYKWTRKWMMIERKSKKWLAREWVASKKESTFLTSHPHHNGIMTLLGRR